MMVYKSKWAEGAPVGRSSVNEKIEMPKRLVLAEGFRGVVPPETQQGNAFRDQTNYRVNRDLVRASSSGSDLALHVEKDASQKPRRRQIQRLGGYSRGEENLLRVHRKGRSEKKPEKTVGKDIVRLDRQALFTDDKYRRQAEQVRIEGDAKANYLYLRAVSSGIKAFHDFATYK